MTFENINAYNYFHRDGSITTSKGYQQTLRSIHSWQSIIASETKDTPIKTVMRKKLYNGLTIINFTV